MKGRSSHLLGGVFLGECEVGVGFIEMGLGGYMVFFEVGVSGYGVF